MALVDIASAHSEHHSSATSPFHSIISPYLYHWSSLSTVIFSQKPLRWIQSPSGSSTQLRQKLPQYKLSNRFITLGRFSTNVIHYPSSVDHSSRQASKAWDKSLLQAISPSSLFTCSLRAPEIPFFLHSLCYTYSIGSPVSINYISLLLIPRNALWYLSYITVGSDITGPMCLDQRGRSRINFHVLVPDNNVPKGDINGSSGGTSTLISGLGWYRSELYGQEVTIFWGQTDAAYKCWE